MPGVNINQTSGLAGSGTNIIIRGYTSISGSNQPLFVVDGVPLVQVPARIEVHSAETQLPHQDFWTLIQTT